MQQSNLAILQNAKVQLESTRANVYADAYNQKVAELSVSLQEYKSQQTEVLNASIEELRKSYEKAVAEKRHEYDILIGNVENQLQVKAKAFADSQVAETDKLIANLNSLIEKE